MSPWILAPRFCGLLRSCGVLTPSDLERSLGMLWPQVYRYTRGQQPRPETLARMLERLGKSEADLLAAPAAAPPKSPWI